MLRGNMLWFSKIYIISLSKDWCCLYIWVKPKIYISWVASPLKKYTFFRFIRWNKFIFMTKNWFSFLLYTFLKHDKLFCTMNSYMIPHDDIHDRKWCHIYDDLIMCMPSKAETTGAGVNKMKISANHNNFITKMFLTIQLLKWIPHFVFCPLIRRLQAFENLKGLREVNGESRGYPLIPVIKCYIFSHVKCNF